MKFRIFAVLALLILPLPALAGPREDAVSSASRCASYGDDRQWLECFYGAAQPVRGVLGLPAAAPSQTSLARAATGGAAMAGPRNDAIFTAQRCSVFGDNRQWLDCYYGAAQPVRARLGLAGASAAQISLASVARGSAASAAGVASASAPRLMPRRKKSSGWFSGMFGDEEEAVPASEFGLRDDTQMASNDAAVDAVNSRMASYSYNRDHFFTVTLENGQTWRQISGDTTTSNWFKPARNYSVNISRGWFGSYDLRVQGLHGMYKVNRVETTASRR